MISKLILSKQSFVQLAVVMFGSLFGFLLLLSSLQLFYDFKRLLVDKEDLLSPQFMVVNKPVSMVNTLTGNNNAFTPQEIREFELLPSVDKVGVFTANTFKAQAAFNFEGSSMYTDMFFESVPNEFIDIPASDWEWQEGNPVPIILPVDYINLYNFGFAPSQNLPQISQGTAMLAPLKIKIQGRGQYAELSAHIAGFTNRINSILIPQQFMRYANTHYGDAPPREPSRIVVLSSDPSNGKLSEFIKERGYETNLELLKNSRMNAILKLILAITLVIGSVIILLSVLGFIQYAQLLVSNSRYEIKTLLELGYNHFYIFRRYLVFYTILLAVVVLLGFSALIFLKAYFNGFMQAKGFDVAGNIDSSVIIAGFAMLIGFIAVNAANLYRMIRRMALPA